MSGLHSLKQASETLTQELYITNILKQLRVTKAIIKDRLEINDNEWDKASEKYGLISIFAETNDEVG